MTVYDICSPGVFLKENPTLIPLYDAIDECTRNLTKSTEEANVIVSSIMFEDSINEFFRIALPSVQMTPMATVIIVP